MRTCNRCGTCFDEKNIEDNPFQSIGTIFRDGDGEMDPDDICPKCREDLGIFYLLAFDA